MVEMVLISNILSHPIPQTKSSGHTLLKAATLQSSVRGLSAREKSPLVSLLSYSSRLTRTDTAVKALLDSSIRHSVGIVYLPEVHKGKLFPAGK